MYVCVCVLLFMDFMWLGPLLKEVKVLNSHIWIFESVQAFQYSHIPIISFVISLVFIYVYVACNSVLWTHIPVFLYVCEYASIA